MMREVPGIESNRRSGRPISVVCLIAMDTSLRYYNRS